MTPHTAIARIRELDAKFPDGPYFVSGDEAEDCPDHANSGLALVDTGRSSDWPIARLCEWPQARFIAEGLTLLPAFAEALDAALKIIEDEPHDDGCPTSMWWLKGVTPPCSCFKSRALAAANAAFAKEWM